MKMNLFLNALLKYLSGAVLVGLDFRFGRMFVPSGVVAAAVLLLLSYGMYAERVRWRLLPFIW